MGNLLLGLWQAYHRPMTANGESLRSLRKPLPKLLSAHASKGQAANRWGQRQDGMGNVFCDLSHMSIGFAAWWHIVFMAVMLAKPAGSSWPPSVCVVVVGPQQ
jgi:hypothetical protein